MVGDVPKTSNPPPVSSVTAVARLALDGVARNVATPVPSPLIPVLTGNPCVIGERPAGGCSKNWVTKVGVFAKTSALSRFRRR